VADAGARSQQVLQSGDGYVEFSTSDTDKIKFIGFSRNPDGTEFEAIDFCIKFNNIGIAEVRESNAYLTERAFVPGDVFRIAIEGGVVKYYKNGSVFHTSTKAPQYPLTGDTSLIGMDATINNTVIAATGNGVLALASDHSPPLMTSGHLAIGGNAASTSRAGLIRRQRAIRFPADEAESMDRGDRRRIALLLTPFAGWRLNRNDAGNSFINSRNWSGRA
jgi:hypothetical protein